MTITLESQPNVAAVWLVRLLLAATLFLGSEVLLWTDPIAREVFDWLLLIPGYVVLGTILLDLLARFQLRDLFGLMTLAGLYSLLNALMLNPETTLFDLPRTLVTRVTGAHALLGLEMLILFLALTGGGAFIRALLPGAVVVGLAWGTWVRWSPLEAEVSYDFVPQTTMLAAAAGVISVILLLTLLTYQRGKQLTPQSILLNSQGWILVAVVIAALVFIRIAQGFIDLESLFLPIALIGLCYAILWFRRGTKLTPIIQNHLPVRPLNIVWIVLATALLIGAGVFAYNLPLMGVGDFNQLTFVVYGFTLYGLAWLPTVSLILGSRAYIRQVQARPL